MSVDAREVYERFGAGLRRFILAGVRDPDAAEDVLQEVYLKIHARIGTVREEERIRSWVYRVARNAVNDYHRAYRTGAELEDIPHTPEDPVEEELDRELLESVGEMLRALPPDHREALVLTEYEGLTQKELAERLGISVSGAKSRVQRARARLKALLLDCCHFELDRTGRVVNYYDRCSSRRKASGSVRKGESG